MRYVPWCLFTIALVVPWLLGPVVDWLEIPHVFWKRLDIGIIIIGSLGVIGVISDAQKIAPRNQLLWKKSPVESSRLVLQVRFRQEIDIMQKRLDRNAGSPFSETERKQFDAFKKWCEKGGQVFDVEKYDAVKDIEDWLGGFPKHLPNDREMSQLYERFRSMSDHFIDSYEDYWRIRRKTETTFFEEIALLLSSVLIPITIFLSLFKALYS